ncbi:MAG: HaeII family restriction endonuclease [Prevotella sp.]|nr:HaeII family restriction endonuclease [Prevotella sp.]
MITIEIAKEALDTIIKKGRVHLYKPIQIAEILYRNRVYKDIDLSNLEDYRTQSKKWRDEVTIPLVGRKCSSTARFQDDLFNDNAIPPSVLVVLGDENRRTKGAVEAYIYNQFTNKHGQLKSALDYCLNATTQSFQVQQFIDSFWQEPGLRRSLDKVYEIIVYSLFSTLVEAMKLEITITIKEESYSLIKEFEDFSRKVMCLDSSTPQFMQDAKVYRVGVTNAADRGLDMYSNWGPAIQIKHLSLDVSLAEGIVNSVSSDKIVIVCKDAEKDVIVSLLSQIGWRSHIQSVVTENDLINWYEKALRGKYSGQLGDKLLYCLAQEIAEEFPSVDSIPDIIKNRHYEKIKDPKWNK